MTMAVSRYKAFERSSEYACPVIARSEATKQSILLLPCKMDGFASLAITGKDAGEHDESNRPRGMERRRQDHLADAGDPAFAQQGPARFRHQARPSCLRCRRARQGFLAPPRVRGDRGSGVLDPALGLDARAARRRRAEAAGAAGENVAGRPRRHRGLQARAAPQDRGPSRRQRQAAAVPRRPRCRRHRDRYGG